MVLESASAADHRAASAEDHSEAVGDHFSEEAVASGFAPVVLRVGSRSVSVAI